MTKREKEICEKFQRQTAKQNEAAIKLYNDAILEVVRAFTSQNGKDEFRSGLSFKQYETLRVLNSLRIDFGDSREP